MKHMILEDVKAKESDILYILYFYLFHLNEGVKPSRLYIEIF